MDLNHENNHHTFKNDAEKPEPLYRDIPDSMPFPISALGDILAPAAKVLVDCVKAPDAVCAQSILAGATLAVQAQRNIEINGRVHPLSEFFLTIAESGERKSALDKIVLRPHREWEKAEHKEYDKARAEYEIQNEAYKKSKNNVLAKSRRLSRSDIEVAIRDLGPPPLAPITPVMIIEEPTYEGVVKLLQFSFPSIGIFSDEGGRLVGGHAMNDENILKSLAGFSSMWDGSDITRTRASDGTTKLYGRRVSMHQMIQPVVANKILGSAIASGQGFLSRCLTAWPKSKAGTRTYSSLDLSHNSELKNYYSRVKELLKEKIPLASGSRNELNPSGLRLDDKANLSAIEFYNSVEMETSENGKYRSIRAFASKSLEHVLRVAGILSVFNDPLIQVVTDEKLQSAIEIVRFYLSEALRLQSVAQTDQKLLEAKEVLDWIYKKQLKLVYPSLIYQYGPRCVRDKLKTSEIVKVLEGHRYLIKLDAREHDGQLRREIWGVLQ